MSTSPAVSSSSPSALTCYTPSEVAAITHISKTYIYELIASGEIQSMKFGARGIRVPHWALERYIEGRVAQRAS
jgi:excisionase family DNA binding protein